MAASLALVVPAVFVLYAVDPAQHMVTPPYPYKFLTGLACPGCGLTRCIHAVLQGEVALAFGFNPWIFVALPAAAAFAVLPRVTGEARAVRLRTALAWVMLAVTLIFWAWRNTSVYPFMRV